MRVYRDRKLICLVGLILAFAVSLTLFLGVNNVFADSPTQINLELDHPISKMEYKELISPIDGYLWDDNAAIIQGTDNSLLLFYNGNYVKRDFTSPKQVKKLYDNYLVVSDNGTLYKVDYTNGLTTSPEVLKDSDDNNIGGNSFDLNESYLITAYTGIRVYSNGTDFTFITSIENDTDTPVHISNDNEIFYVYQNSLYKYSVSQQSSTKLSDHKPSALATVGEYLYYSVIESENSVIYRIPINGGESVGMTVADLGYDLGVLKYVSDICVKDGKLIITDKTICAVQEFEIDNANEKLIFTGFAIAKNKTAFEKKHPTLFDGQALHARRLELTHPKTGERMSFECPLPEKLEKALELLEKEQI